MRSEFTLDDDVIAHIQGADKTIKQKSQWSAFDCKIMLNKLESIVSTIQEQYVDIAGLTMNEAYFQIYKGTFSGNLKTFINYTNGLVYVRKLQSRIKAIKERGPLIRE